MRRLAAISICGLATALACGQRPPGADESAPATVAALQAMVERAPERLPPALRGKGERAQAWAALRAFYGRRGFRPAWSVAGEVQPAAERLVGALDGLAAEGLDPRLYPRQELASLLGAVRGASGGAAAPSPERRTADLVDLDVGLTYTFLVAAGHLAVGRLQPSERARLGWHTASPQVDLVAALERAVGNGGDPAAVLSSLAPRTEGYSRLRRSLASYRDLAAKGGWPPIPPGPRLRPGDTGPRVAALAARLAASGDLPAASPAAGAPAASAPTAGAPAAGAPAASAPTADAPAAGAPTTRSAPATAASPAGAPPATPARFDAALAEALSRFQARHGLDLSASVDAATLAALEVPLERRIRQLELNLERWRWMGSDFGDRYVLVNIPDFRLHVVDGRKVVLVMRVIVGKAHQATPAFSDPMTQIVLNPTWHIPDSIAANEIAPQLLRDPGYLSRKGLAIKRRDAAAGAVEPATLDADEVRQLGKPGSSLRLVQPPGADNALGRYKFVVNDRFDVYLHDTPTGQLFARSERDFSHGCIRLEKPAELAQLLLAGDPKWTPEAISEEVESGRTVTIPLPRPIPVHIIYQTAWADPDGTLELRNDIYKHDAGLETALAAATPLWQDLAALRHP